MGLNTGIEWRLRMISSVGSFFVAARAYSLNIKPMLALIASNVIILFGGFTAIETRQCGGFHHATIVDGMIDSPSCLLVERFTGWFFCLAGFWPRADKTFRSQTVVASDISAEHFVHTPSFTFPAVLLTRVQAMLIFLECKTRAFSSNLEYTKFASHK